MAAALLNDRSLISLAGPDARTFLQGLVTNDVEQLSPGGSVYAALLTPQGKILFDFFLREADDTILIDCATLSRDALTKRLSLYRLRSKVTIEPIDHLVVVASWENTPIPTASMSRDPRLDALGERGIIASTSTVSGDVGPSGYRDRRLALGIPEAADFGSDHIFALDGDLEELHAISFDKGCYVGQELTARMKHRGSARKRLLPVSATEGELPESGAPITADDREIGELSSRYGRQGFALVRLDRLAEAGAAPVVSLGVPIVIQRPSWLLS